MSDATRTIRGHYGRFDLLDRIFAALEAAGIDPDHPRYEDLFLLDQLHGGGIEATRAHAERAGLRPGMHVLDLGCGIGGCSRPIAVERQCRVTGIDLTREFVEAARELTRRCGIGDGIAFEEADALALPFPDGTFDHVWCHYVTMNIADKRGLAAEIARVLKPSGRFSLVEVAAGPAGAPTYPMPWALEPAASFLAAPGEMEAALTDAGLRILAAEGSAEESRERARRMAERQREGKAPPVRNDVVMGDDFPQRSKNYGEALGSGRIVERFILAEKP